MNIHKIIKNLFKKLSKQNINLGFSLAAFLLAVYSNWSFELAVVLALLVYSILGDFKPDFYKKVAIIFAVISAIALTKEDQSISEKLGVISFVSLLIYLALILSAVRKQKK